MKTFSKTFAVIALVWAILSPPLLSVLDAADGVGPLTRLCHQLARDLRSALPAGPASDPALVSLPGQWVSNSAKALDWAGEGFQKVLALRSLDTLISSVVIVIMSICILRSGKRNSNITN